MALTMVLTGLPVSSASATVTAEAAVTTASSVASSNGLAENVQDGAILHCWCWSFDTIKANMKDIANAGFTTIQTSPANECNDSYPNMKIMGSDTKDGTDGCWWWHYQPTDWKIGNYQLGTKAQFQAMCDEADKYGIKVVVDVIPNHVTPDLNKVSQNLYNAVGGKDNLFHANGFREIGNGDWSWGNRLACTTGQMGGLPDVNTENPDFQKYFLNYLNDLINCGADGFRYDTAKHIGVPSDPTDPKSAKNNFWPVVTGQESVNGVSLKNKDSIFNYGEVLQGDNVPEAEYAQYMRMTASSFGGTLRSAVTSKNFNAGTIKNLQHATPSRLVTWVESHDTYCNAGESVGLTDTQIRLAWAVIAARKDGTPLFFSRPDGSNGWSNRWGNNVIGAKGNDQFKAPEVKAVNFFRNAMVGQPENIVNPNNNSQILQIDRGTLGTCIINLGTSDASLNNVSTTMADGTYKDQVSGSTFKVSGGKLTGKVGRESVAVVYNQTNSRVFATAGNGATSFSAETLDVTLSAVNVTNAKYTTSEGASGTFKDGDVITIGAASKEGDSITLDLTADGEDGPVKGSYTYKKVGKNIACISLPSGWDAPKCYVYNTAGAENAAWPGAAMQKNAKGEYEYEVPDSVQDPLVIFYGGDNSRRYPGDMEDGLPLAGKMIYHNGVWEDYEQNPTPTPTPDPNEDIWKLIDGSYDVYAQIPSGWGSAMNCYAYESETSNNAAWPGIKMTDLGKGIYAYNLPESWTSAKVIFNDGKNQYPASQQPGLDITSGTSMAYVEGKWQKVVVDQNPSVSVSLADKSSFDTESKTVTLTLKNADKGTYCVDDGPVREFTDSVDVVIGQGKIANSDIKLHTTASKGDKQVEKDFSYHKKFNYTKNGGYTEYEGKARAAALAAVSSGTALDGEYATNPGSQKGSYKTINSAADFDDSMIIAQGVANDDPRIFRGSHEGPVYDTYALYGAWDDTNIYLGWQYTNVTDVVDPAQGYPISDNGKPYNGDIPQILAFNLGTGNAGGGLLEDGGYVWGLQVDYQTPIDAMMCFSSKPDVGTPALFTADASGSFSYDTCVGFKPAGISYTYEDGFFGSDITGVNGNGYSGYTPSMVLDSSSNWTNFLNEGHSTSQDTFYTMSIPMASLGVTKSALESNGIGVMHISTFGQSGIGSLPMDMSMLDQASAPYSADSSTSAEKEDVDVITVPLARLGAESTDPAPTPDPGGIMTVNFGADRSSPQLAATELLLKAEAAGGDGTYTYQFLVDGREVQNSESNEYIWNAKGGDHKLAVTVTDGNGIVVECSKDYTVEGESPADPVQVNSLNSDKQSGAAVGTPVVFTANAVGGEGTLQYRFSQKYGTATTVVQDYSTSNSVTLKPDRAGTYTIIVDVKDGADGSASKSVTFAWAAVTNEFKIDSFTASKQSPQPQGTSIKLTAAASGGSGTLQYRFSRVLNGKTTIFRDYSTSNEAYCNPQAGEYTLYVDVKDAAGKTVSTSMNYKWKEPVKELKVTKFTASKTSPQPQGSTIQLTALGEGGSGELKYRFYRVKDGMVTVFRDYQKLNTAYCNPAQGSYTLYVDVMDEDGNTATSNMAFTWGEPQKEPTIKSFTASKVSPQPQGTSIRLDATVEGGSGKLQYRFYRVGNGKTTVFRDYASSGTAYCNPVAGDYLIYVDVKDSAGNVVTSQMLYTWK